MHAVGAEGALVPLDVMRVEAACDVPTVRVTRVVLRYASVESQRLHPVSPEVPILRIGAIYGVAQYHKYARVGRVFVDAGAGSRRVQVVRRGLSGHQMRPSVGEQTVVRVHANGAKVRRRLIAEEVGLLAWRYVDLRVLRQVAEERRRTALRRANDEEVRAAWLHAFMSAVCGMSA